MRRTGNVVLRTNTDQAGNIDFGDILTAHQIPRRPDASCQRQPIRLGLVCKGTKHAAALMHDVVQRRSKQGVGDRIPVTDTITHADAETSEDERAHTVGMLDGEEGGDARAHRIAHDMGLGDAEMGQECRSIPRHGCRMVGFRIMRLGACTMAAIVDRDHPVARVPQRSQPTRIDPVDACRRGKAMDEQDRIACRIAIVEIGKLKPVIVKAGKRRGVEIHEWVLVALRPQP